MSLHASDVSVRLPSSHSTHIITCMCWAYHQLGIVPRHNKIKFTTESIEKGDVWPLKFTLPLEGATGEPQVSSEGGDYSNSRDSDSTLPDAQT